MAAEIAKLKQAARADAADLVREQERVVFQKGMALGMANALAIERARTERVRTLATQMAQDANDLFAEAEKDDHPLVLSHALCTLMDAQTLTADLDGEDTDHAEH